MNFSNAPELINGRLAMLAFVSALGAEFSTQESVVSQFKDAPLSVIALVFAMTIASIVPLLKNAKREALGPLTPEAEMTNGRAAMLGVAFLLAFELARGKALF